MLILENLITIVFYSRQMEVIMNKILNAIIFIMFFSVSINAQNVLEDSAKAVIKKLFELSKTENYEMSSNFIAYDGNDQNRYLKSSLNFSDSKEAFKAKRIVKRIKAFLDISDSFSFGAFELLNDPKFNLFKVEISFKSGEQELKTVIILVKYGNKFLITDLK